MHILKIFFFIFSLYSNISFCMEPDFLIKTNRWLVFLFASKDLNEIEEGAARTLHCLYKNPENIESMISSLPKESIESDDDKNKFNGKIEILKKDLNDNFIDKKGCTYKYIINRLESISKDKKLTDTNKEEKINHLLLFLFINKNECVPGKEFYNCEKVLHGTPNGVINLNEFVDRTSEFVKPFMDNDTGNENIDSRSKKSMPPSTDLIEDSADLQGANFTNGMSQYTAITVTDYSDRISEKVNSPLTENSLNTVGMRPRSYSISSPDLRLDSNNDKALLRKPKFPKLFFGIKNNLLRSNSASCTDLHLANNPPKSQNTNKPPKSQKSGFVVSFINKLKPSSPSDTQNKSDKSKAKK